MLSLAISSGHLTQTFIGRHRWTASCFYSCATPGRGETLWACLRYLRTPKVEVLAWNC